MSSKAQIEANRRNGMLSKGPKTVEGRAASAKNALKHGMLSDQVVLAGEDHQAYFDLENHLYQQFKPGNVLEQFLVTTIAAQMWRLSRATKIEAGILEYHYDGLLAQRAATQMEETIRAPKILQDDSRHKIMRGEDQDEVREERNKDVATLGLAFIKASQNVNAFSTLSRYQKEIERSLYKAIHELERVQAARKNEGGPVPVEIKAIAAPQESTVPADPDEPPTQPAASQSAPAQAEKAPPAGAARQAEVIGSAESADVAAAAIQTTQATAPLAATSDPPAEVTESDGVTPFSPDDLDSFGRLGWG